MLNNIPRYTQSTFDTGTDGHFNKKRRVKPWYSFLFQFSTPVPPPPNHTISCHIRSWNVWRWYCGYQKSQVSEQQTIQWPKGKKNKQKNDLQKCTTCKYTGIRSRLFTLVFELTLFSKNISEYPPPPFPPPIWFKNKKHILCFRRNYYPWDLMSFTYKIFWVSLPQNRLKCK